MSARVIEHKDFLKYLTRCRSPKQRQALIKYANPEEIKSLCECILNVYKKNVKVGNHTIKKLRPFKKTIASISNNPTSSLSKTKKLLSQRGGAFLPILLGSILPAVISAFVKK